MDLSTLLFPISHRGEMGMQIFLSKPILGVGEHIQTSSCIKLLLCPVNNHSPSG